MVYCKWPWLRIGVKKLTVESYVRLGIEVRNNHNSKRTFKNEQLASHKQFSEQTRQIFSKKFAWINKIKTKKNGHNLTLSHLFDAISEPWSYTKLVNDN